MVVAGLLVGCEAKGDAGSRPELPPGHGSAAAATVSLPASAASEGGPIKGGELGGPGLRDGQLDAPVPQAAFTLPNLENCQSSCLDANRMKAVAKEQLEADCRDECKSSCLAQCESQTDAGKKACKADCERQAARIR